METSPKSRIFISYKRQERTTVAKLSDKIGEGQNDNNIVWYDTELRGGDEWWKRILAQINEVDVFICLLTNASMQSPFCQAELREALRLCKHILPIKTSGKGRFCGLLPSAKTNLDHLPDDLKNQIYNRQIITIKRSVQGDLTHLHAALNHLLKMSQEKLEPLSNEVTPKPEGGVQKDYCPLQRFTVATIILLMIYLVFPWSKPDPDPQPEFVAGIASLTGCSPSAEALRQDIETEMEAGDSLKIQLVNESIEDTETARQIAEDGDIGLLIWGACATPDDLSLHYEVMTHNTPALVFDLPSISVETSVIDLREATIYSKALVYYSWGGRENYERVTTTLSLLDSKLNSEIRFIQANAHLYQGYEHYEEALEGFEQIKDDAELRPMVLNNLGVTMFNIIVGDDRQNTYSAIAEKLIRAHNWFEQAISATDDRHLLEVIQVNQARLLYLYAGDDEEGDFQKAIDLCSDITTAEGYICRAAAQYYWIYDYADDSCQEDLQPLFIDLERAQKLDSFAIEADYWRFWINNISLNCADDGEKPRLRDKSNAYLKRYKDRAADLPVILEIDLYFRDTEYISPPVE